MSSFETGSDRRFDAQDLQSSVIAIPLLRRMEESSAQAAAAERRDDTLHSVLIATHRDYPGLDTAETDVRRMIREIIDTSPNSGATQTVFDRTINHYVVARLSADSIRELVRRDLNSGRPPAIYHIWPDFEVYPLINKSAATVKADAARTSFAAKGTGIVWAVLDSGIDARHRHFAAFRNLEHDDQRLHHRDFTLGGSSPRTDDYGHGTHVAGIIAGDSSGFDKLKHPPRPVAIRAYRDEHNDTSYAPMPVGRLSGMAPECGLVSYKVLDENGRGGTASVIAALQHVQRVNDHGETLRIHGVNLSVGYPFDPTWFACGQSPICAEVDRLVNSGVVVVVAAGNSGYDYNVTQGQTINDPGNAELAITVGSTHRDMPHTYGVSYFSSKGPTGDGRAKPDLLAPGERILSCAAGTVRDNVLAKPNMPRNVDYVEDFGTSMAAAHVSGVIAAFLSVRQEFIGKPAEVKRIFTSTATDLGRVRSFQGNGLIDLMRAIQSV